MDGDEEEVRKGSCQVATWDPQALSLEEYLGDFRYYLDARYNRWDNGLRLFGPPVYPVG